MPKKSDKTQARIPSNAELTALVLVEKNEATELEAYLGSIEISHSEDLAFAADALKSIAEKHDTIDAKRKTWVDPLNRVVKDINATFKPVLDSLKKLETGLKVKIGQYHATAERERVRLLEEAGRAASSSTDFNTAESLIARAELLDVPKVDGLGVRMIWTGEVVDAKAIPREYLTPDIKKLLAVTEAGGADPQISGWRAFPIPRVSTKRSST